MPEYGFYSQRMCNRLLNEFTGDRCALEEGHAGRCRSKEMLLVGGIRTPGTHPASPGYTESNLPSATQPQRSNEKSIAMTAEPIKPVRKSWTVYRSAVTGRYVTRLFAQLYPDTTVEERRTS